MRARPIRLLGLYVCMQRSAVPEIMRGKRIVVAYSLCICFLFVGIDPQLANVDQGWACVSVNSCCDTTCPPIYGEGWPYPSAKISEAVNRLDLSAVGCWLTWISRCACCPPCVLWPANQTNMCSQENYKSLLFFHHSLLRNEKHPSFPRHPDTHPTPATRIDCPRLYIPNLDDCSFSRVPKRKRTNFRTVVPRRTPGKLCCSSVRSVGYPLPTLQVDMERCWRGRDIEVLRRGYHDNDTMSTVGGAALSPCLWDNILRG